MPCALVVVTYEGDYHRTVHDYLHDNRTYERFASISRSRYFDSVQPGHAVFEYGCGLGQNLFGLPAQHKLGYDISEYAREFCAGKGLHVVGSMESVPRCAFDFVISRHSLEHLEAPTQNLHLLRSLLKPSGRLILILPEEPVYRLRSFEPDTNNHLFSWTPRTLANLLFHTGFAVQAIRREPNSGLRFFAPLAERSYALFRLAMRLTDLLRHVHGEWVADAKPRD